MRASFARSPIALALAASTGLLVVGPAQGAGFLLNESSASGLGGAFAGGAAAATDAGTLWSNPAGLARLKGSQLVIAGHLIRPSMKLVNESSVAATSQALGGDGGDAGSLAVVPNLYVAVPLGSALTFGLGVTAPWGLVTEYDDGWIGRFQAVKSSIKTYNVNPALSLKVSDGLSLGLGLNFQRLQGEFTKRANYSAALTGVAAPADVPAILATTPGLEAGAKVTGSDNGYGWNIGLLWNLDTSSRVGIHYRSRISYHLTGDATFAVPSLPAGAAAAAVTAAGKVNAGLLYDSGITSDVKMPDILNLSYFRALDGRWDVMADAQWTGWSAIQALTFTRTDGKLLDSTPLNFKNSWKFAVGINYRPNNEWTWRGGLALDQSPVQDEFRTPRLPDADRTWLTGGGQVKVSDAFKLDFGAAYIWVKKASINTSVAPKTPIGYPYGLLNGHYNSNTTILSMQGTWSF